MTMGGAADPARLLPKHWSTEARALGVLERFLTQELAEGFEKVEGVLERTVEEMPSRSQGLAKTLAQGTRRRIRQRVRALNRGSQLQKDWEQER